VKAVFKIPATMADEAAGILVAGGALGCAVQGIQRDVGRAGKTVHLEAFFRHLGASRLSALGRTLGRAGMLAPGGRPRRAQRVIDPGWATLSRSAFKPFRVGRRFLIVPAWKRASEPGRASIVIDPGQAFGTGRHPTTAGALRAIERLCAERPFQTALDVGTGSGILALAMARLGVADVLGIDVDAIALENAQTNLGLNRLDNRVRFSPAPVGRLRGRFDLIVANILSSVLVALAPRLKRLLARNGRLVIGGILKREVDEVAAPYAPEFRLVETRLQRGWATMVFKR
jgi:ribosomal protein L11 methyltransferase